MNDIKFAVVVSQARHKLRMRQSCQMALLCKLLKQFVSLRNDSTDIGEAGIAFTDVDRSNLARPLIHILEQMTVYFLQTCQGNAIEVRFKLFDARLGQLYFS